MTNLEETVARNAESVDLLKCSFCGKSQKQVKKLIAGPGVYICDECIELCNEIVDEELGESGAGVPLELPKPQEIFDFLNQYVIGQEAAKRAMSVAVYNHYKRVQVKERSVAEGDASTGLTQLLIDDLVAQLDALVTDVDTGSRDELLDLLLALATEGALEQIHTLSVTCHSFLQIRLRSPHPGATASAYGLNRQVHRGHGGVSSPQYAMLGTLLPAFGGFIFTGCTAGAPAGNRQERRRRCHCPTTTHPTGGQEEWGEAEVLREVSTWSTIP